MKKKPRLYYFVRVSPALKTRTDVLFHEIRLTVDCGILRKNLIRMFVKKTQKYYIVRRLYRNEITRPHSDDSTQSIRDVQWETSARNSTLRILALLRRGHAIFLNDRKPPKRHRRRK
jgi:hypothetical protein